VISIKKSIKLFILMGIFSMIIFRAGFAQSQPESAMPLNQPAQSTPELLCQPGTAAGGQDYCIPLESSEAETAAVTDGSTAGTPAAVFDPQRIDPALSAVPFSYAKLNLEDYESAPLYGSAQDAIAGVNSINSIPAGGIRYVSYTNRVDSGSGHYVQAKNGGWLRASPAAIPTSTLGRTFTATPANNFGWVFEGGNPYTAPNYNSGVNKDVWFNREDVLEVFEVVENQSSTWFRVGENQWLDRIHFRCAYVKTTPPEGVTTGRWIEIDLLEQVVMVYENNSLVYAALVATGMKPFYTQPGLFQIYKMVEAENMTGAFESDKSDYYSLEDVPFAIYYDQDRALHGAYWRAWFGYEQSHGCTNMTIGDAHWLYNWAEVGDWIWVHDPSGNTPTDPSYYGAGGA